MTIIDGQQIAANIRSEVKSIVEKMPNKPGLTVILVGNDPASQSYVGNKEKDALEVGFNSQVLRLPEKTSEVELLNIIDQLNKDIAIHGILVQLPVPKHIDEEKITLAINPHKDVDGFHPMNTGALFNGSNECYFPCTAAGIIKLIKSTGQPIAGKKAVVIGRSNIVGKPTALMLLREHATVTIAHSRTKDLAAETRQADILVVAVGKAGLIKGDMVKPGAIVIDVGTNRVDGKLIGDVDFESVKDIASFITPVPKGVGPMTRALLLLNTLQAAQKSDQR